MVLSSNSYTHRGGWDESTRAIPALAFIEKYVSVVDSVQFSGPSHRWYAPSSTFYNGDGVAYRGGDQVWDWMKGLFGPFSTVSHNFKITRLLTPDADEVAPGRDAQWILFDCETSFSVKDPLLAGDPITIPRMLMFLVGRSEIEGQGTDGLQILEAKAWWDTGVLNRELAAREERRGLSQ